MPPRDTVAIVAYWIFKIILSPVLFLLWRVQVEGRDRVPEKGPAILAANHQSFSDSLFLPLVLRRRVTYVAKAEYFDSWKTAWFFRAAGQIPIRREGGSTSQRALDTACEVLRRRAVARHLPGRDPGSRRASAPRPHRGDAGGPGLWCSRHPGGDLGDACGPAAREDDHATVPHGDRPLRHCRSTAGPLTHRPTGLSRPDGHQTSVTQDADDVEAKELRVLTDALMVGIAELSGQAYVDDYAKRSRGHPAHPPVEPGRLVVGGRRSVNRAETVRTHKRPSVESCAAT